MLESRIFDGQVELTLQEVLGIAKKEFHEVIIDVIQRKRQVIEGGEYNNDRGVRERAHTSNWPIKPTDHVDIEQRNPESQNEPNNETILPATGSSVQRN